MDFWRCWDLDVDPDCSAPPILAVLNYSSVGVCCHPPFLIKREEWTVSSHVLGSG